jgi:hypothetical protein
MPLVIASIYVAAVLVCVGGMAWLLRAWTRTRYRHEPPSDLQYLIASTALLMSAGIGVLVASQIVLAIGHLDQQHTPFRDNSV